MVANEYQPIMRLIFAKIANEMGVKYKVPKFVEPHHFNMFFKNLRVDAMLIEGIAFRNYSLYVDLSVDIKKTVSELIEEYGYWDNESVFKRDLIRFEDYGDFIKMYMPYNSIMMSIYDKDVRRIFDYFPDDDDNEEKKYVDGFFSVDGALFIPKHLIGSTYIFFEMSCNVEEEISRLLSEDTYLAFARYGC